MEIIIGQNHLRESLMRRALASTFLIALICTVVPASPPDDPLPRILPSSTYTPMTGDTVALHHPKGEKIRVARDLESLRRFNEAKRISGAIVSVDNGIGVRILAEPRKADAGNSATVDILILEGKFSRGRGVVGVDNVAFLVPVDQVDKPIVRGLMPDPSWVPKPGDLASVDAPSAPAAAASGALDEFRKLATAKDDVGIKALENRGIVAMIPKGTGVLVLKRHEFSRPIQAPRIVSATELSRMATRSALRNEEELPPTLLEVRFKGGPLNDQARLVLESDIKRLIPTPVESPLRSRLYQVRKR